MENTNKKKVVGKEKEQQKKHAQAETHAPWALEKDTEGLDKPQTEDMEHSKK